MRQDDLSGEAEIFGPSFLHLITRQNKSGTSADLALVRDKTTNKNWKFGSIFC